MSWWLRVRAGPMVGDRRWWISIAPLLLRLHMRGAPTTQYKINNIPGFFVVINFSWSVKHALLHTGVLHFTGLYYSIWKSQPSWSAVIGWWVMAKRRAITNRHSSKMADSCRWLAWVWQVPCGKIYESNFESKIRNMQIDRKILINAKCFYLDRKRNTQPSSKRTENNWLTSRPLFMSPHRPNSNPDAVVTVKLVRIAAQYDA